MRSGCCVPVPIMGEDPSCSFWSFQRRPRKIAIEHLHYDVIMSKWLQTSGNLLMNAELPDPASVPGHGMATTEWIARMRERTCTGPYLLQRRDRASNPKLHEDA